MKFLISLLAIAFVLLILVYSIKYTFRSHTIVSPIPITGVLDQNAVILQKAR